MFLSKKSSFRSGYNGLDEDWVFEFVTWKVILALKGKSWVFVCCFFEVKCVFILGDFLRVIFWMINGVLAGKYTLSTFS